MPKRKASKPVKKSTKEVKPVAQTITVCRTPSMPLNDEQLAMLVRALGMFLKAGSGASGFFSNKRNATDAWRYLKTNWGRLDSIITELARFASDSMFDAKNFRWLVSTETRSSSGFPGGVNTWWRDGRLDRSDDFDDED